MRSLLTAVPLCFAALAALAMDFDKVVLDGGALMLTGRGPIRGGDDEKLHRFVGALPAGSQIVGIALHSPGGNLYEATLLAETVRRSRLLTGVTSGSTCASACFLVFAAGTDRMASETARIGVHSVSEDGEETVSAAALTTMLARDAAEYGVPPAVVGKLVLTPPNGMTWLTQADLRSMRVEIIPDKSQAREQAPGYKPGAPLVAGITPPLAPPPRQEATAVPSPAPAPQQAAPTGYQSPAYQQGLRDRRAYEEWFGSLYGELRSGAAWWAEVRSQAQRDGLTCTNQGFAETAVRGCWDAQTRLAAADARRGAEPDYRAGWNAYGVPGAPTSMATQTTVGAASQSVAFDQGLRDRSNWEKWFNGMSGEFKNGAAWWAENRSRAVRDKLTCAGPGVDPVFVDGCMKAKAFLAPVDQRRRAEPDYRAGWNSYTGP